MDFLKILRSFEEFLFEATSWLIFYPLTLWRIVRNPLAAMDYSDRQQSDSDDKRYDDSLSPPLVLLATLVVSNLIAVALHEAQPEASSSLMQTVTATPQNLVLFRSLVFSLTPLIAAASLLHRQGRRISRETLRAPFYAQCYLAAACVVFTSLGAVIFQLPTISNLFGLAVMIAGVVWFMAVQTAWFRRKLDLGWIRAAFFATWAVLRALLFLFVILIPVAVI